MSLHEISNRIRVSGENSVPERPDNANPGLKL